MAAITARCRARARRVSSTVALTDGFWAPSPCASHSLNSPCLSDPPFALALTRASTPCGRVQGDRKRLHNWRDASCGNPNECRPRLLGILDSTHCKLHGLNITSAIYWTLTVLRSAHVTLDELRIYGDRMIANNDGMDIDSSTDVLVSRVHVDTGDDGICLKTSVPHTPLERVTVQDCTVRSRSSALKLGSASRAPMRDILMRNITVRHTSFMRCATLHPPLAPKGRLEQPEFICAIGDVATGATITPGHRHTAAGRGVGAERYV